MHYRLSKGVTKGYRSLLLFMTRKEQFSTQKYAGLETTKVELWSQGPEILRWVDSGKIARFSL
ncbi:hypothetical protein CR917_20405 [Pseudomonas sp. BRM28]|nr:hypothetical protein CR917_20405 [Pseudomonas sp. BRM28]